MTWLVSTDRFLKSIVSALSSVIGALKKSTETEYATDCLLQLLLAAEKIDFQVVETMVESTVVAAQKQVIG